MPTKLLSLVALTALLATAPAQAKTAAGQKPPKADKLAAPDVKQWELANGLKVIFLADHRSPVASVQIYYHAGGKDEPADKRGIAHMFEHMMFKGSRHVPPEMHARFVDSVGGRENAFTQDDLTGYFDDIPPGALEFVFKLEADRMRGLVLTQKTIDSEREVVKEELRVRLENSPVTEALDRLLHLAYTVHPYRQFPIGEKKMLDTITVEDCQKFYDKYYRPNNATLVVVGDTDEANVRKLADQYFGPLERGPAVTHDAPQEPPQDKMREATVKLPARLPVVIGAYHIPAGSSDDIYALEVLQQVLSGGESSRMYQRLVRKDHTAVAAGGFVMDKEDPGLFLTFAVFLPGSDVDKIKAALADEIGRVTKAKISDKELAKAKNQLAADSVYSRERVDTLAREMGVDGIVAHDPLRAFKAEARYDAITAADVQRVAQKYLVDSNYSLVTLQPSEKNGGQK